MSRERDGVYTRCSEFIAIAEDNEVLAIQTEKLADKVLLAVDLSDITREELERRYVKAVNAVCLNQHGYRSVIAGHGYYVNFEACKNLAYLYQMLENAESNEESKKAIRMAIQKHIRELQGSIDGQMRFDGNGNVYQEPTIEEILRMLEEDSD